MGGKGKIRLWFSVLLTIPVSTFGERDGQDADGDRGCHPGSWVVCGEVFLERTTAPGGGWEELKRHWLPRLPHPLLVVFP